MLPIKMAVKMSILAKVVDVVIGQKLYDKLDSKNKGLFRQLP